jgi:hypothetical protein
MTPNIRGGKTPAAMKLDEIDCVEKFRAEMKVAGHEFREL